MSPRAEQPPSGAAPAPAGGVRLLLWSTGIAAAVLAVAAFILWGVNGAAMLFDMIVALCT